VLAGMALVRGHIVHGLVELPDRLKPAFKVSVLWFKFEVFVYEVVRRLNKKRSFRR
jgi:hypothetical protein